MADRYPLEPLLALTGWSMTDVTKLCPCNGPEYRLRREQGVTELIADRLAGAAGLHPFTIWPELEAVGLVPCAECEELFPPTRKGHRFCSHTCRERRRMRVKYQTNPAWREQKLAARRAYYQDCADYEKADAARRYWADPEKHRQARRERHHREKAA